MYYYQEIDLDEIANVALMEIKNENSSTYEEIQCSYRAEVRELVKHERWMDLVHSLKDRSDESN